MARARRLSTVHAPRSWGCRSGGRGWRSEGGPTTFRRSGRWPHDRVRHALAMLTMVSPQVNWPLVRYRLYAQVW